MEQDVLSSTTTSTVPIQIAETRLSRFTSRTLPLDASCFVFSPFRSSSVSAHEFISEPREQFYQRVDREGAEALLEDKQNGTFIIRPSASANSLGTMSITQDNRIFHLNIRQREDDMIALGTERINEKHFADVNALINYHISNYLILYSDGETYRTLLLPYRG